MPSKMPNPKTWTVWPHVGFFLKSAASCWRPGRHGQNSHSKDLFEVQIATFPCESFNFYRVILYHDQLNGAQGMRSTKFTHMPSGTWRFGIPNLRSLDTINSPAFILIGNVGAAVQRARIPPPPNFLPPPDPSRTLGLPVQYPPTPPSLWGGARLESCWISAKGFGR